MSLEIAIYRNGILLTPIHYYTSQMAAGSEDRYTLPMLHGNPAYDIVSVSLRWDGEPVRGWQAFRAGLIDCNGCLLTPWERPGLLYVATATDCPSVTTMQANRPEDGVYALCLRGPGGYRYPVERDS